MRQFLFLWFGAVIYIICDMMRLFLSLGAISPFFFAVLLIVLLPLWNFGIMQIKNNLDMEYNFPSFPRIVLLIGVSGFAIWYFGLILPLACMVVLLGASLLGLMNAWILLLISAILITMMPIVFLVEKRTIAELLALSSYTGLAFGFVGSMFTPWISKLLMKISWIEFSPPEWQHYIRELEWILHWYLRIATYIFPLTLIYIFLEESTWPLFLSADVPMFLIVFLYFSFLVVPLEWKAGNFLSVKI